MERIMQLICLLIPPQARGGKGSMQSLPRFRKNVSNQFITQDMCKFDDTTSYLFTNKVSVNLDVLGSMVKYKILCVGIRTERPRLLNKLTYHMSLAMVEARDLFLASAVDLEMVASFLTPQEMRL
jgi:hypothetical protein